jgi:hypothetical protein
MSSQFSRAALEALANVITGGPGNAHFFPYGLYRSGYELECFFQILGYDVELGKTSRVPWTLDRLIEINNMPDGFQRIAEIIEQALDPRDYAAKYDPTDPVQVHTPDSYHKDAEYLSNVLKYDQLELYFDGTRYRVGSTGEFAPALGALAEVLDRLNLEACRKDFSRALARADNDPDGAATSASSMLESVCKSILDHLGKPYPKDESLAKLYHAVATELNLGVDQHSKEQIKRVLGALANVVYGIGTIRTQKGDAHGRGSSYQGLEPRHSRLVINAASTAALFLVETYLKRSKGEVT